MKVLVQLSPTYKHILKINAIETDWLPLYFIFFFYYTFSSYFCIHNNRTNEAIFGIAEYIIIQFTLY